MTQGSARTTVRRLIVSALAASALLACGAALPGTAAAQPARDLIGSWTPVLATLDKGQSKADVLGPNPKGLLMLGGNGRFALITLRSGLPKFASGARMAGTARENKAIVQGSVAHFSTYSVDAAGKVLVFRVEAGTFPNWDGAEQRRGFTLRGDTLPYTTPGMHGAGAIRGVWKASELASVMRGWPTAHGIAPFDLRLAGAPLRGGRGGSPCGSGGGGTWTPA